MKKTIVVLVLVLVTCSFLSACEELRVAPTPSVSSTETPSPAPKPTSAVTPGPTSEEADGLGYDDIDKVDAYLRDLYSYEIEQADNYRVKVGDTEYYFDTAKLVEMDLCPEFPLYRQKQDEEPEYLGTTGFSFQVIGDYIYVESDLLQDEDPPGYALTRVVNLNDLTITPAERNMTIFFPKQGSKVYYTLDFDDQIYITNASLMNPIALRIEVPDKNKIEQKTGFDIEDAYVFINITDVIGGWIHFSYWLCEYEEGPDLYNGNYRIKTDGSKIEKIGEGQFGEEIDLED